MGPLTHSPCTLEQNGRDIWPANGDNPHSNPSILLRTHKNTLNYHRIYGITNQMELIGVVCHGFGPVEISLRLQ